mgnify:CR=1 FL=1
MGNTLSCHKCNRIVENVSETAVKVTCSYCVLTAVGIPKETIQKVSSGRPAGWHFMGEFVDKDGNVFHRGKEQPKLFGTLKPTKVVAKKRTKRRSQEEILLAREADKKAALKKAVQKQKDFINHKFGG